MVGKLTEVMFCIFFYAVFLVFYPVGGVSAAVPDCI